MKLNIKKILEQVGYSEKEFAEEIGITLDELQAYKDDTVKMSGELLSRISNFTGLLPKDLHYNDNAFNSSSDIINPSDTWSPSYIAKNSLTDYIKQGLEEIHEDTVQNEIKKVETCIRSLKKPKISFAGQSDTGKSTLINALLGAERMPAKWTPTTSIVVYIKHTDDRPSFISDDVWILGKQEDVYWNDSRLDDESYCRRFLLAKGNFSILETYGTHQQEVQKSATAVSAVAFIDSPLLKNCDILDLPGFAASAEDDALHKFNTQDNITDILIYLSRSNGFLQDRDLDYLSLCLNSLRPVEQNNVNDIEKLENLFIIASQANAVNNGNASELQDILDRRCHALCTLLSATSTAKEKNSLLPTRSKLTGYNYSEEDFRKRFFSYERDLPRLCNPFRKAFTSLAERLPKAIHKDFCKNLNSIVTDSTGIVSKRICEYESMMAERTQYLDLVQEIKEKEPARKVEQKKKNKQMLNIINELETETKQMIQTHYNNTMTADNLIHLIGTYDYKNKKGDREEFALLINKILSDEIKNILNEKSSSYTKKLNEFLSDYSASFTKYESPTAVNVQFDTINSFALGLASLGALGASAAWLATSFTAWSVAMFGTLAGLGPILAVGGVIGIAIGALIAGVTAVFKAFTWKKSWANSIIDTYEKNAYITKIFDEIEHYWSDTKNSFTMAADHVETDWGKRIEEYESLADETNLSSLQNKLSAAKQGLDFFTKIPIPENG